MSLKNSAKVIFLKIPPTHDSSGKHSSRLQIALLKEDSYQRPFLKISVRFPIHKQDRENV